jgi:hypothetical protein
MDVDDREFIERFEDGTLPEDRFHHVDHVRLAWLYLSRLPLLQALDRYTTGLKRFAAAAGKPDRYHETITWAYLFLIHERMERAGHPRSWEEFIAANPDLEAWDGGVLGRYYRKETLDSGLARRIYLLPDGGIDRGR